MNILLNLIAQFLVFDDKVRFHHFEFLVSIISDILIPLDLKFHRAFFRINDDISELFFFR